MRRGINHRRSTGDQVVANRSIFSRRPATIHNGARRERRACVPEEECRIRTSVHIRVYRSLSAQALVAFFLAAAPASAQSQRGEPWPRHTIDEIGQGADGARPADINGDGRIDFVVPWEESGHIRVCFRPAPDAVREPWPSVTVGRVRSPEDAVAADVNGDGALDVISLCEGDERAIYFHLAPTDAGSLGSESAWTTRRLEPSHGMQQWMYALPWSAPGEPQGFVAAGKGTNAALGVWAAFGEGTDSLSSPERWTWTHFREVGWIMSLTHADMDGDGEADLVISDRKGAASGCSWFKRTAAAADGADWREHLIGGAGKEVMFIDTADMNGDGAPDVIAAIKPRRIVIFGNPGRAGWAWTETTFTLPPWAGTSKSAAAGDLDGDGVPDIAVTCEQAEGDRSGVLAILRANTTDPAAARIIDISGPEGVKFDRAELLDIDGDGRPDIVTCEERENLGVVWYRNPGLPAERNKSKDQN